MTNAASDDPFAGATLVFDPSAAPPPDATPQVAGNLARNPLVAMPMQAIGAAARKARDVADAVRGVVPGIFERADSALRDPFAGAQTVLNTMGDLGSSADQGETGWAGGWTGGTAAQVGASPPGAALSHLDNIRTGLQRGLASDAGAPVGIADIVGRALHYAGQGLYNITPPMRVDLGPLLGDYTNRFSPTNGEKPVALPKTVVNFGGAGFGPRWLWNDKYFGPAPEPAFRSYDEAHKPPPDWVGRMPEHTLDLKALGQSADHGETGWADGLFGPQASEDKAGSAAPLSLTTPSWKVPDPSPVQIVQGVDKGVTALGRGANAVSDFAARQTTGNPDAQGRHIDLSPHDPANSAEEVEQELAAGFVAPGRLFNRLAVSGASALMGQIPGIKGSAYELPARIGASVAAGTPFSYRAGLPSEAGQVLRRNTRDFSRADLDAAEGWQKNLKALGLDIMPPEVLSAGRGDVPAIVNLSNKVAGTDTGGAPFRAALNARPKQVQGVSQAALDDALGPRPADVAGVSDRLARAGQAHVDDAAGWAKTADDVTGKIFGRVEPGPVGKIATDLDRTITVHVGRRTAPVLSELRDQLTQTQAPGAMGAAVTPGSLVPAQMPETRIYRLDALRKQWEGRLADGSIEEGARPAVRRALDDLTDHMTASSPVYRDALAEARASAAQADAAAGSRAGRIAEAPTLPGSTPTSAYASAHDLLFNPAKSSPEAVAAAARALNEHDPGAFRGLVSEWINRELAAAYGHGTNPEMGAKFAGRVFGDPDKQRILKAALDNVVDDSGKAVAGSADKITQILSGLGTTDTLSRAAAKAPADFSIRPPPGMLKAFGMGAANTIPPLREALKSRATTKDAALNAKLGDVLSSGTGMTQMLDLMYRGPQKARAASVAAMLLNDSRNVGRSIMFGNGGGLPRSPLLDPPQDQR